MNEYYKGFNLGVLGGGQLGRMLIQSAINLNIHVKVLDPSSEAPCKKIASEFVCGMLSDFETVYNFGKKVDVLTIEIESVNIEALKALENEGVKVFPQSSVLEIIQDKRKQKQFYLENNIPTANFTLIDNKEELLNHIDKFPVVQKLGRDGYDGRGVQKITSEADLEKAFTAPSLIEDMIDFEKELSVIVSRNEKGETRVYPVVELVFHPEKNLVEYLFSPANISEEITFKAKNVALDVIDKFGMVGILAVEMFLTKKGEILVNEVAPRPHNSGHQTIEGNITSQYEQHLRSVLNLPLGDTSILKPSAMVNLLGEEGYSGNAVYKNMEDVLEMKGVHIHLYGKKDTKPFRKMGHVTITGDNIQELKEKTSYVQNTLKVISQ